MTSTPIMNIARNLNFEVPKLSFTIFEDEVVLNTQSRFGAEAVYVENNSAFIEDLETTTVINESNLTVNESNLTTSVEPTQEQSGNLSDDNEFGSIDEEMEWLVTIKKVVVPANFSWICLGFEINV